MTDFQKAQEMARNFLMQMDMNTCICDCIPCKTTTRMSCDLGEINAHFKNNELCCQDDLEPFVAALLSFRQSGIDEALAQFKSFKNPVKDELTALQAQVDTMREALEQIARGQYGEEYRSTPDQIATKALSTPKEDGR